MSLTCYGIVYVTSVPDICPQQISGMVTCESLLVIVLSVLQVYLFGYRCVLHVIGLSVLLVYLIWLQACLTCITSVPNLSLTCNGGSFVLHLLLGFCWDEDRNRWD